MLEVEGKMVLSEMLTERWILRCVERSRRLAGCLLMGIAGVSHAQAEELISVSTAGQPEVRRVEMVVRTTEVLTIDGRIPKFQVDDEELLVATPISANQIRVFAKSPGIARIDMWDTEQRHYPVQVEIVTDFRPLESLLNGQIPFANLRLIPVADSAILSGTVRDPADAELAMRITQRTFPDVINNIKVIGAPQVLLHTKIMEVSRTKLRDLGVDWCFDGQHDARDSAHPKGGPGLRSQVVGRDFPKLLAALRRENLIKLLAEPTVVATHGRLAKFRVGGRVPSVVANTQGVAAVGYEDYGTSVDFLPYVLTPQRLRLEVRPEIIAPDESRGVVASGVALSAFTNRYVETAVEMQFGQTLVIAGLTQIRCESTVQKTPLLGELPGIGGLFRRVRNQQNEIELLIMITPEMEQCTEFYELPAPGVDLSSEDLLMGENDAFSGEVVEEVTQARP
ncbi:MAG: hypothetical protein EHM77_00290 [Planctomycetaceae bacterium]|nr:MAG: hypothetical protein EHM77_00290 [Planctomycetaceae bacterium]